MDTGKSAQLKIQVVHLDAAPAVYLAGEIDLSNATDMRASLEPLGGRVLVDLREVSYMDSTGIAVLVATQHRLAAAGGALRLRAPCDFVRRVIEVVGIGGCIIGPSPPQDSAGDPSSASAFADEKNSPDSLQRT
jgi:stage II sporulation protein AA (anti-sigma F factor antagonist)